MSHAELGVRPLARDAGLATAIAAGGFLLLARPALSSLGASAVLPLGLTYAAILAMSSTPVPTGPPASVKPVVALAVGLVALALAVPTQGLSFPLHAGPANLGLSAAAAVAEEAFFRRLVYGALQRRGVPVAIFVSALAFALMHLPLYGPAAFWVDLGAGLLFGWQRWASGGIGAPATTHVAGNILAVLR